MEICLSLSLSGFLKLHIILFAFNCNLCSLLQIKMNAPYPKQTNVTLMRCVQTLRAHTSAAALMDIKEMVCDAKVYLKKVLEGHISVSENQRKLIYVAKRQGVGRFK